MGEAKKKQAKNGGGETKTKDEGGPTTVVLKLDVHCEGCALKIRKFVKTLDGVDAASTDLAAGRLTVVGGGVDPWALRERLESRIRRKIELLSPANAPKKSAAAEPKKASPEDEKKGSPPDEKKLKPAAASTVVLRIRLHCEGCIQRIRKTILNIKGVESVSIEPQKDLVTVKGTMDANSLPFYLKEKLKRAVEVVPQKKDSGGDKKAKGGGDGDKKEKGGEKTGKEGGGNKNPTAAIGAEPVAMEASKMEYAVGPYGTYRIEMVHAPQLFSDENPNACSVM